MLESTLRAALLEVVAEREALDDREAALVVAARSAGATWTELGAALGLSKQGTRRRHLAVDPIYARRPLKPPTIAEYHAEMLAALQGRLRR